MELTGKIITFDNEEQAQMWYTMIQATLAEYKKEVAKND
jgi:hypothetical protein